MVTWGLGIEHEFILKFQKKKIINNNYYDIYINSKLIENLNRYNEINFYQNNKSFIKNDPYYKKYCNHMEDLILIRNYAINNKKYPFEKKQFFNITSKNKTNSIYKLDDKTIQKMKIYLFYFTLYNVPILFFNYIFQGNEIYCGDFESLLLKCSANKEELVKYNYDLFNILFEEKNILNFKNQIFDNLNENYTLVRMNPNWTGTTIKLIKDSEGNIKNQKDLLDLVDKQSRLIKKYLFNDIKFNENIIKKVFYCYCNNIPELDTSRTGYVLEMRTIDYANKNYENAYKDFIKYESSFIEYIDTIFETYIKKYGKVNYNNIGSRKESIELIDLFNEKNEDISYKVLNYEDYTGSYHLWITVPYDEKISKLKFLNIHANLANKLQMIEPILACNFSTPSYQIKYNKNYPTKLSLRHLLNNYSNYGTSDVSLINGSEYTYVNDIFFDKKNSPEVHKISKQKKKVYNENNTLLKSYDALEKRFYTNNLFTFLTYKINNSKNINIKSFYELLFKNKKLSFKQFQQIFMKEENKKIKPRDIDLGSDIRTRNNNYLIRPLDDNIKKIYYPKNNRYIEYYLDENNNLLKKRKYDKEKYKKYLKDERIGIEFRILDHFPTIYLDQILSILPYLLMESYNTKNINSIYDTHISKQYWHNEMYNVIIDGYNHNFSKKYIENINNELNLNLNYKKYTSDLLLKEIYEEFNIKYSKLRKFKKLLDKLTFKNEVVFINFNELATKFIEHD